MEKEVLELIRLKKFDDIKTLLNLKETEEVSECVSNYILRGRPDPINFIKYIINGSLEATEKSLQRCTNVIISIIKVLQKNEINSKTAFGITSLLLTELDLLKPKCLADLAQFYIDSIKNGSFNGGKSAELLPKILVLISSCDSVPKGEGDMKGSEFKGHVINSICSCRWAPSVIVHMATFFHEIPLTLEELKFVIEKIVRMFAELELSDQPAVVFQLLLLSAKGHKKLVLEGICKHYTLLDDVNRGQTIMVDSEDLISERTCLKTLRQIEGTVILHITTAIMQDQELGTELIKYLKILQQSKATKVISPFNLSLLLSISQLHHFEDQVFDFVKSTILKCFRDDERQHQSLWVRECYPVGVKTEDLVLEAVDHSYELELVTLGLVKLGFGLMDSFGPKLVFGAIPEAVMNEGHKTPVQQACQLAQKLLLKTFKAHEVVRSEILDQIFNFIMKSTSPVTHYLELLADTVYSAPQLLLESTGKVQELFVKLVELPLKTAEGLLNALQPLLKLSPLLKDTLILVLRKALFSRQLESRKIGAIGFLLILKSFRVVGGLPSSQASQPISLSQLQVDVHSGYNAGSNEALCLEILGNLRRCFIQQADIRTSIYMGLYQVLQNNSKLLTPVLDMLMAQLKKYYEANEEVCPPLRFEPCILTQGEQVYLAEPLAHLISCIQHCLHIAREIISKNNNLQDDDEDEANEEVKSVELLETVLENITSRMITAEMEDFELDKSADFSTTNGVGVRNNIHAILLVGLYEVLMENSFLTGKYSEDSCKQVLQLFAKHEKVITVVRESTAGKKGKVAQTKTPNSLISLSCVVSFLQAIIIDNSPEHESGIKILREDKDFLPYLICIATQKLNQMSSKGTCDGEIKNKEKLFKAFFMLGRLFHLYYVEHEASKANIDQRDRKLISQCLEGLDLVVGIACKNGLPSVLHCLGFLEKEPVDEKRHLKESDKDEKIHQHIKRFQRLVSTILSEDKENQNLKEMTSLISVIANLASYLSDHGEEYQQVHTWVLKVATEQTIDDAATCRQLLSVLFTLAKKTKSFPQILRNVCQDIHSQLGDIEQDTEIEDTTNYTITRAAHCPTAGILSQVLTYLESELDDVDWVIKCHKAEVVAGANRKDQEESMDRPICTRLGMLVTSFIELTHSAVRTKPCSHGLLKAVTKLYNTLTLLTKHYITMYTSQVGQLGSRFEKLVTLVGKQLTPPTYSMIIYIQMSDTETTTENDKKEKGKKKASSSAQNGMIKTMKQMKVIPNLIFAIEQFEKFLMQLSKKSKVNLLENIKISTSRDFRIISKNVDTVVEQEISSDDSDGQDEDETTAEKAVDSGENSSSDQENKSQEDPPEEPPAKKKKRKS